MRLEIRETKKQGGGSNLCFSKPRPVRNFGEGGARINISNGENLNLKNQVFYVFLENLHFFGDF